jgi:hypothetical protein
MPQMNAPQGVAALHSRYKGICGTRDASIAGHPYWDNWGRTREHGYSSRSRIYHGRHGEIMMTSAIFQQKHFPQVWFDRKTQI